MRQCARLRVLHVRVTRHHRFDVFFSKSQQGLSQVQFGFEQREQDLALNETRQDCVVRFAPTSAGMEPSANLRAETVDQRLFAHGQHIADERVERCASRIRRVHVQQRGQDCPPRRARE